MALSTSGSAAMKFTLNLRLIRGRYAVQTNEEERAMKATFLKLMREEDGATAVEYGVLVALIIAVCIVVIQVIGTKIETAFEKVNANLKN
ncbi:MAG: Flp family type IVb pilin [Desulfuromonas sp.]|nr:Flp family type IVb pilin [Desulfuromonas sp.]